MFVGSLHARNVSDFSAKERKAIKSELLLRREPVKIPNHSLSTLKEVFDHVQLGLSTTFEATLTPHQFKVSKPLINVLLTKFHRKSLKLHIASVWWLSPSRCSPAVLSQQLDFLPLTRSADCRLENPDRAQLDFRNNYGIRLS